MVALLVVIIVVVIIVLILALHVVKQYEQGVIFWLGRITGTKEPGLAMIIPFIERLHPGHTGNQHPVQFGPGQPGGAHLLGRVAAGGLNPAQCGMCSDESGKSLCGVSGQAEHDLGAAQQTSPPGLLLGETPKVLRTRDGRREAGRGQKVWLIAHLDPTVDGRNALRKFRLQRRGNSYDDPFVWGAHLFTLDLGPYPIHGLRRTFGA